MSTPVVMGSTIMCTFGLAPSTLVVAPAKRTMAGAMPVATITDCIPIANIPPFGMCTTLSNPMVASLTAAALGVLTPAPCIPVTTPWAPGSPTVLVGGIPAVNNTSKCMCAYGGSISVLVSPATTVTIP